MNIKLKPPDLINNEESDLQNSDLLPSQMNVKLEPPDPVNYEESNLQNSDLLPSQMNIKLEPPDPINYEESNLQNSDCRGIYTFSIKEEGQDQLKYEEQCENDYNNESIGIYTFSIKEKEQAQLKYEDQCENDYNNEISLPTLVKSEPSIELDEEFNEGENFNSDAENEDLEMHEEVERTNIFGDSITPWKIKIENVGSESMPAEKKRTKRRRRKKLTWSKKKSKPLYFKCTYCIRSFCTQELLDAHLNIHNETILVCTYCNFGSTSNYSMTHHVKHVHKLHSIKIGVDYFRKNHTEAGKVCNRKEEFNNGSDEVKAETCLLSPDIKRKRFTNKCLCHEEPVQQNLKSSKSGEREKDENSNLEMFSSYFEFLLNQKFKKNLDNCELQCFYCLLILDTLPCLMVHIFRNHFAPKLFKCNICKYLGYFPLIFHPVVKSKHDCSEILNEKIKLRKRSDTAPFESNPCTNEGMPVANRFRCGLCGVLPSSNQSITSHMHTVHCQLKQFHCKCCDFKIYYPLVILEKAALLHQCKHNSNVEDTVNNCSKLYNDEKNVQITNIESTFIKSKNSEIRILNRERTSRLKIPRTYCCIKCDFYRTVTAKRWKHSHIFIDRNNRTDPQEQSRQLTKYVHSETEKNVKKINHLNIPRNYCCFNCGFSRNVTAKRWKHLKYHHVCVDTENTKDSQGLQKSLQTPPKKKLELKCGKCVYVPKSEEDLYIHTLSHCNKNFLTCKHCPYLSFGVTSMRKHVKTFHNEDNEGCSGLPEVTDVNIPIRTGIKKRFVKDKVNGEGWNCFDIYDDDNIEPTDKEEVEECSSSFSEEEKIDMMSLGSLVRNLTTIPKTQVKQRLQETVADSPRMPSLAVSRRLQAMCRKPRFCCAVGDTEKRSLHNNMERMQRIYLRNAFEELRLLVPTIADSQKAAKVTILKDATHYVKELGLKEHNLSLHKEALRSEQDRLMKTLSQLRRILAFNNGFK